MYGGKTKQDILDQAKLQHDYEQRKNSELADLRAQQEALKAKEMQILEERKAEEKMRNENPTGYYIK